MCHPWRVVKVMWGSSLPGWVKTGERPVCAAVHRCASLSVSPPGCSLPKHPAGPSRLLPTSGEALSGFLDVLGQGESFCHEGLFLHLLKWSLWFLCYVVSTFITAFRVFLRVASMRDTFLTGPGGKRPLCADLRP